MHQRACNGTTALFANTSLRTAQRRAALLLLSLLLAGCRINIVVPEGGKVTSVSGDYDCAAGTCTIDVTNNTEFDETFVAVPNPDFVFDGWRSADRHFCQGINTGCRLVTTGFPGSDILLDILASNDDFFLQPVFRPAELYSAGGTIEIASTSFTDGDVNDPQAAIVGNDTIGSAQSVPNPVNIGGYVTVQGEGNDGPMKLLGDRDDFFAIDLVAGQTITLIVAEPDVGDLDLYLYNDSGEIVGSSLATGFLECIQATAAGRHFLNVYAWTGASNYTLTVGQGSGCAGDAGMSLAAEFVPGEAIVSYRSLHSAARASDGPPAEQLVALETSDVAVRSRTAGRPFVFRDPGEERRWQTLMAIKALKRRSDVELAEPNYVLRTQAVTPDDPLFALQRHYSQIGLPEAWETTVGSENTIVAVIDTGVLLAHPDLADKMVGGYDFISDASRSLDGDGIDPDANDDGDSVSRTSASSFHGSHVAGTIAASSNNGVGVAGVDWLSKIMPIRTLGLGGSGTLYDIIQGFRYAAGLSNDAQSRPARHANIINMSLGGGGRSQGFQNLVSRAREKGIFVVAAAGNDASGSPEYPASYDGVISVGAVDWRNQLAPYSNFGPTVDLVAPGGDSSVDSDGDGYADRVLSTVADDTGAALQYSWDFSQGTSMAAPHVAGVIALMLAVNPDLTPEDLDNMLVSGDLTVELGEPGRDDLFGYGVIDARKAITAAIEGPSQQPAGARMNVVPSSISLTAGSAAFSVSAAGDGSLEVTQISTSASWLQLEASDVNDAGLGTYALRLQEQSVPQGTYAEHIDIVSTAGEQRVPVIVYVGDGQFEASSGIIYALLLNEDYEFVEQQILSPAGGAYEFRFDDIREGTHYLIVGSDMDNDGFICDSAEACGAYRLAARPQAIVLDRDLSELDFPVGFDLSLSDSRTASSAAGNEPGPVVAPTRRQRPATRPLRRVPGGEAPIPNEG